MNKSRLVFFSLGVLAVVLFCSGAVVRRHVASAQSGGKIDLKNLWAGPMHPMALGAEGNAEPQEVFQTVYEALKSDYVDKITDTKKLTYGALDAMVDSLNDPYSQFLTPERRKAVDEAGQGLFHGLGAIVLLQRTKFKNLTYERLQVANVLPGSPAEKAGLTPGDVIARINERYFIQIPNDVLVDDVEPETYRALFPLAKEDDDQPLLTYKEALAMLSEDGKTVPLTIQHPGQAKTVEVKATLGPTQLHSVESRIVEPGVGYLAVHGFTKDSPEATRTALKSLEGDGAHSLIVDLRNSFGGSLDAAKQVAAQLTQGSLGYLVRQKAGKQPLTLTEATPYSGKIVVLVNNATLGTSELLAAALEEESKAAVVGVTTFGDGLDETLIPFNDGSAIQLTTGKFLTSSGAEFHQKGIKPTYPVAGTPEKQLQTAVALAKGVAPPSV